MVANAVHLALAGFGIIAAMMLALWIIHLLLRNAAIVDVGWAAGLATLAIFYAVLGPGYSARKWAMAAMAGFWDYGWRFICFFTRAWQAGRGALYPIAPRMEDASCVTLLVFFRVSGGANRGAVLPFLLASLNPAAPLGRLEKIGAAIWLVSICGEAVADYQLNRFRKNPENRGKTYRRGLWAIPGIPIISLNG